MLLLLWARATEVFALLPSQHLLTGCLCLVSEDEKRIQAAVAAENMNPTKFVSVTFIAVLQCLDWLFLSFASNNPVSPDSST